MVILRVEKEHERDLYVRNQEYPGLTFMNVGPGKKSAEFKMGSALYHHHGVSVFTPPKRGLLGGDEGCILPRIRYSIDMNLGNANLTISLGNELDTLQPEHKMTWNGHS